MQILEQAGITALDAQVGVETEECVPAGLGEALFGEIGSMRTFALIDAAKPRSSSDPPKAWHRYGDIFEGSPGFQRIEPEVIWRFIAPKALLCIHQIDARNVPLSYAPDRTQLVRKIYSAGSPDTYGYWEDT